MEPKQLELSLNPRHRPLGSRPKVCRQYHVRLWKWLAENPEKMKDQWPGWKRITRNVWSCFPCMVARYRKELDAHMVCCSFCPIKAWASLASKEISALRAPCEIVGPYQRWKDFHDKLDALETDNFFHKKEGYEKEKAKILSSITLNAMAVANLWGDCSLNGQCNTNI